jgi:hypothetical protein
MRFSDRALVIGTAACVHDDLAAFQLLPAAPYEVFIVNEAFRFVSSWDHWVSLHPEKMAGWREEAAAMGRATYYRGIMLPDLDPDDWDAAIKKGRPVDFPHTRHDWRVPKCDTSGSSGLFAARLAIRAGYGRVVLAGIPMDNSPHVGRTEPWADRDGFAAAWIAAEQELNGKVLSFSGWSSGFLGKPTSQWWCH